MKELTVSQVRAFKGPIDPGRRADKPPQAGQCTCPVWPYDGPASSQWATCLGSRCKGCRLDR